MSNDLKVSPEATVEEKLQVDINICAYKIQKLEEIRQIAQQYDGKVFNKKFTDLMNTIPDVASSISRNNSNRLALSIWVQNLPYNHQDLVYWWNCEDKFVLKKRFIFSEFSKLIDTIQESYRDSITKLQNDILTGMQRLEKWNEMVRELNNLRASFSEEFILYRKYDFDRVSNPRN